MSSEIKTDDKSELKSLKDFENIDDLDFDKIELIRGKTPQDIKERCLQLCKDYLSGNWTQQKVDTIEVRRVTGGLINQLYYCGIKQADNNEAVPQEVAIRLYGNNIFEFCDKERIRDVITSLIFSEKNVGPKIYGLFNGGQIQKFYKHRQFKDEEQKKPELVRKVVKKLAYIHSWDVPLKKDPWWFYDLMVRFYEIAVNRSPINQLIDEYNCETFKKYDLKTEIDWIKGVIEKANSPVLFTHNDFRSSNLMITEPNDELVVCDYDITGYGYRGYDFVSLMREWGRKQFDIRAVEDIPEAEFRPVIEIYVEECVRIHGKSFAENAVNSVDHILKEVKIFTLFSYLFGTVFCLKIDEKEDDFPMNKKLSMEFANKSFKDYIFIKNILKEQNIID